MKHTIIRAEAGVNHNGSIEMAKDIWKEIGEQLIKSRIHDSI